MVLGTGRIVIGTDPCRGLKDKRKIVRAIVSRIQNKFNASVAEVEFMDLHQRAVIGFALVGNDSRTINSKMDKLIIFVENLALAEILDTETEIIVL